MSAAPGDRPRDDSFEDKGSPAQDAKDGDVKHVVSLRRQDPTPSDRARRPPVREPPPTQKRRCARGRGEPRRRRSGASDTGGHAPLAKSQARCLSTQPGQAPQKEGESRPDADGRPAPDHDGAAGGTYTVFLAQNTSKVSIKRTSSSGLHLFDSSQRKKTKAEEAETRPIENDLHGPDWTDRKTR